MNLSVLPLADFQEFAVQKCLLPREFFPENVPPGALAKCVDSSGCEYVCRIFSMDNENNRDYCIMDKSVVLNSSNPKVYSKLARVECVEMEPRDVEKVSLVVIVNERIFKLKNKICSEFLKSLLQDILRTYYLINGCSVHLDVTANELGIDTIIVNESYRSSAFFIGSSTDIEITDVKLTPSTIRRRTKLASAESAAQELANLLNSIKLRDELNWKIKPSSNALIIGPPGSGKTAICDNFLVEHECSTFLIRSADVIRQYPGETEEVLRGIFSNAIRFVESFRPKCPTVIQIEDIDLICPASRSSLSAGDNANTARISAQLISLLDDLHAHNYKIIVLATTSNVDLIDLALRRPGRFDKEIQIPSLNEIGRKEVLNLLLSDVFFLNKIESIEELIAFVAKRTPGFVGADLTLLIQQVSQVLLRSKDAVDIKTVFENVLKTLKPSSIRETDVTVYTSEQKFSSLGGMNQLKKTLEVSVLAGLRHSEAFARFGLSLPKGILLYGPPGCAKTTIAKCLATEANMTFIATSGAEVYSPYVGNAEKFIAKIFNAARRNSPCLIFLDEIDTLVGKRSMGPAGSDVQTRILSTLLTEMDGIGVKMQSANLTLGENQILVVAATNRPDMVDDALMRPGRFDKLVHVPAPDYESRLGIFKIYSQKMSFNSDVDISALAAATKNFSGADICNLCNEAAMHAFTQNFEAECVNKADFEHVLGRTKGSLTQTQIDWYKSFEAKYNVLI